VSHVRITVFLLTLFAKCCRCCCCPLSGLVPPSK
jgi:hypothetical protein